jgi:hypothetical protein
MVKVERRGGSGCYGGINRGLSAALAKKNSLKPRLMSVGSLGTNISVPDISSPSHSVSAYEGFRRI